MYYFRGLFLLVFVIIIASCTSTPNQLTVEPQASFWSPLGTFLSGSGAPSSDAGETDIALDNNGFPVVAWSEFSGSAFDIYVKRWNGSSWQDVGTAISAVSGNTDAFLPSLALDSVGNPVVAFQEDDGSVNNIYAYRFSAGVWQPLGGALSVVAGGTDAYEPSLALDSLDNPVVAWREQSQNPNTSSVYVRRFIGGTWQAIGGALSAVAGDTDALEPSLKIATNGNPVVAWQESNGVDSNIYVYRFAGTWQVVGGALSGSSVAGSSALSPSLDLDSASNPVVAWRESNGGTTAEDVYVYKFSAGTWQAVGGALNSVVGATNVGNPYLVLDSANKPVVAWDEATAGTNNVYVRRWSGSVWQGVGGKLSAVGANTDALAPAITLDSSGSPIIAWSESSLTVFNIHVQQYFKNVWINAGSPIDISLAEDASSPAIAISSIDQPFLTWKENTALSAHDVYVKSWNGTAWTLVGNALDRTQSNDVSSPAIATSGLLPYVAWGELNGAEHNVYVSQWTGASWTPLSASLDGQVARDANYPSVKVAATGPVVAWQECASTATWDTCTDHDIWVKKWNSLTNTWDAVGSILDGVATNDATRPSLALNSSGNPVVAWQETNGTSTSRNVVVKAWDGVSSWTSLGTVDLSLSQDASLPSLAIDASNRPVIAWKEKIGSVSVLNYNIYVKRWNGTSWDQLGATLLTSSPRNAGSPSLSINLSGNPVVAFSELVSPNGYNIYVKQWLGTKWVPLGSTLDNQVTNNALSPALVVTHQDKLFTAWQECASSSCTTPNDIYVKQF
jgi:hypothetical protein